jgi:hypothetical protein
MSDTIRKHLHGTIKQVDRSRREITALLTHQVVDADGEVVMADGADWSRWRHNAPMLYQHDRERKVGNWDAASLRRVTVDGAPGWTATGRLFSTGALADQVYGELQEGPTGISIGFRPTRVDHEPVAPGQTGRTFRAIEVIEASLVTLQSCPTCTVLEKTMRGRCGGDVVLELREEDEADLVTVDPVDVVVGVHQAVDRQVCAEVRRQTAGLLGWADAPVVFLLDDDEPGADDAIRIDPAVVRAAVDQVLGALVHHEVRQAVDRLRGRVD